MPSITTRSHSLKILTASTRTGTFASTPEGHLGFGVFFQGVDNHSSEVTLNLFQAISGDADGDITDFNSLANHFTPSGYAGEGPGQVPEPSTLLLVLLAMPSALQRVRRR